MADGDLSHQDEPPPAPPMVADRGDASTLFASQSAARRCHPSTDPHCATMSCTFCPTSHNVGGSHESKQLFITHWSH
eukprot:3121260-Amphidinium_carterae.1